MIYLKHISLFISLSLCYLTSKSQIIDTVQINDIVVYHVSNFAFGSQLFWEVNNAEIISENPTYVDSIVIKCYSEPGIIRLSVYEISINDCIGEVYESNIIAEEQIISNENLYVPNIFTPNGDEINDHFKITPINEIKFFHITIFNRWGVSVFDAHDINYSWDGRVGGEYCTPGVYYYVIQFQNKGKVETKNGFLHLFR